MNLELLAVIAGIIGAVFTGIQVWQGRRRRRRESSSPAAATQALREEAVTTLMDAMMDLERVDPFRAGIAMDALETLEQHSRALVRLRSRMRIASGIRDPELEAFNDAAQMAVSALRAVAELASRELDYSSASERAVLNARWDATALQFEDLRIAFDRFEEVLREGARQ
jgi:hypothetical protein